MTSLDHALDQFLARLRERDSLRALRPGTPESARCVRRGGRTLINFSSNDYLGLSQHPELVRRACEWTENWGTGSGASRLMTGDHEIHAAVEEKVARLKKTEAALLLNSGFQANATVLPALLDERLWGEPPLVLADLRIHASMHDGLRAAGVRPVFYRHDDLNDLEERLRQHASRPGPRIVLTESVFSMDGDCSDVPALAELAERWGALLYLDEAHATGVLGPNGMGLSGTVPDGVHVSLGTFSKGLGGFGAYVACSGRLRDYLVNRCRGLIFSTSLPPGVLGAMDAALDLVPGLDAERSHLRDLSARLRDGLVAAGVDTSGSTTQIVPAVLGDPKTTLAASAQLEAAGVLGVAIRPPSVPRGTSRIRFSVTAAHREADVDAAVTGLTALAVR
ncbi:MAG: 8-amino-7-ketopelargonate synthase [Gemmatimonadota bacterium]|nr:MAG: 8-amino-7-ketopelargonate synthase [Gemmatimonadota bacterium]